ncbi:uncharacterized protein METZ01_LOCUS508120 [marine metagenome]|uniref:Uncharacterized protein n=1 Tax=marine metagenome TaxID=408172 RepID=A0A383EEI6_9ZZZZ
MGFLNKTSDEKKILIFTSNRVYNFNLLTSALIYYFVNNCQEKIQFVVFFNTQFHATL